jgi:hypothetical protein
MTENCKFRRAILSAFYNISQRNFGILLILWYSFKLWWNFCLDQNFSYKGKGPFQYHEYANPVHSWACSFWIVYQHTHEHTFKDFGLGFGYEHAHEHSRFWFVQYMSMLMSINMYTGFWYVQYISSILDFGMYSIWACSWVQLFQLRLPPEQSEKVEYEREGCWESLINE